jgi:predicted amidohydrolase
MSTLRIALANIQFPATPEESVTLAEQAIARASAERADIVCFPECFVPGYRAVGKRVPPADPAFRYQPYGQRGLLVVDIDLAEATGLLAARCKSP